MEAVKRINILGCPFDAVSFPETVHHITQAVVEDKTLQVVPGNVDFVMKARRDPLFAQELWRADLVVADGVPIVWAASMLGDSICGRVSGTDLVWSCAEISAETGCAVALIGGKSGVALRAAQKMRERYPQSKLYAIPTAMPLDYDENVKLVEQIRAVHASIILVALGAPRQERWVQANLAACKANVGIGIGSAFDIICGDTPRAPDWMKDRGLEWLYRMLQEPRRLGKRYLIEDSPFLLYLAHAIIRKKQQFPEAGGTPFS
jgi:N-acetylglucosaminyldiphosphoundecaprenol N-acetyl-beta-D-mannosaminyltransferase